MYSSISGLTCIEFLLLLSATLDQPSMRLAACPPPSPRRRPPRHFASHCCATQLRIRRPQHPPAPARPLRRSSRIHRAHPLDPCCIPPACLLRTGPALSEWFIQTDVPLLGLFWLNPYAFLGIPTRFPDRASTFLSNTSAPNDVQHRFVGSVIHANSYSYLHELFRCSNATGFFIAATQAQRTKI
jgi:hypothetical protein